MTNCGEIFGKRKYNMGMAIIPPPTPKIVDSNPTASPVISKKIIVIKILYSLS